MVVAKNRNWRGVGVSGWLTPRPITHLLLLLLGAALSWAAWKWLDAHLLAYISGLALPLCMMSATAIWGLRDKADETLDGDHLDANAYRTARKAASRLRLRSMRRATIAALCGLAAAGPSFSLQITEGVWEWMVYLAGPAVAESIYSYMLALSWDEQLRAWRERDQIQRRERDAQSVLLERARSSQVMKSMSTSEWSVVRGVPKDKSTTH
jgi:hypothetical protein